MPTGLGTDCGTRAVFEAIERAERRRAVYRKVAGRMLLVAGLASIAATVWYGGTKRAGAADWYIPSESVSILTPAYTPSIDPATGLPRGDSVHAACDGPGMIEVGVHPWDGVARSLQVFAADGRLLLNVNSADHVALIPIADQPAELRYSETASFGLLLDLCATPVTVPPTTVPPTTTVPAPTTGTPAPTTAPSTIVEVPLVAPPPTVGVDTGVLSSSTRATLPATGATTAQMALVGAFLLLAGFALRYRWRNA